MRKNSNKKKEPFLEHLGNSIRVGRIDLFLSQEQLGFRSGLHRTYITDIENGLRNMSLLTLRRVATALDSQVSGHVLAAEKAMVRKSKMR
jgi:transcriptional regulator with XRE-family HTH domain